MDIGEGYYLQNPHREKSVICNFPFYNFRYLDNKITTSLTILFSNIAPFRLFFWLPFLKKHFSDGAEKTKMPSLQTALPPELANNTIRVRKFIQLSSRNFSFHVSKIPTENCMKWWWLLYYSVVSRVLAKGSIHWASGDFIFFTLFDSSDQMDFLVLALISYKIRN